MEPQLFVDFTKGFGHKDISKLQRKRTIRKDGVLTTVYVNLAKEHESTRKLVEKQEAERQAKQQGSRPTPPTLYINPSRPDRSDERYAKKENERLYVKTASAKAAEHAKTQKPVPLDQRKFKTEYSEGVLDLLGEYTDADLYDIEARLAGVYIISDASKLITSRLKTLIPSGRKRTKFLEALKEHLSEVSKPEKKANAVRYAWEREPTVGTGQHYAESAAKNHDTEEGEALAEKHAEYTRLASKWNEYRMRSKRKLAIPDDHVWDWIHNGAKPAEAERWAKAGLSSGAFYQFEGDFKAASKTLQGKKVKKSLLKAFSPRDRKKIAAFVKEEKSGVREYKAFLASLSGKARQLVAGIIKDEKKHKQILQNMLDKETEKSLTDFVDLTKATPRKHKKKCSKCGRTDRDLRGKICDKCAFPEK